MSGSVPLLQLYISMEWTGTTIHYIFYGCLSKSCLSIPIFSHIDRTNVHYTIDDKVVFHVSLLS